MSFGEVIKDTQIAVNVVKDTSEKAVNVVKDVWSKLDAASEKPKPSEYLSGQAIHNIQGKSPQG